MTAQPARSARASALASLESRRFDLLVIGGGITGAGIARDAALRGLTVALVEARDFASGTSSRSSRLVHGGVRYLEHGYLHLVLESVRERRTLLRIAPHLVRRLPFLWPVYAGARIGRWKLSAALWLYDALAAFRSIGRHRRLGAAAVAALEPALGRAGLRGGAIYWDAATSDTRLTLATVLGAAAHGAVVANHLAARELLREGDRVVGAVALDAASGRRIVIRASVVANATGPWSDRIRQMADPGATPAVQRSKGVHIAVPRERLGDTGERALTLVSPVDGRVMFILPAGPLTIVGTTETEDAGAPESVRPTAADVEYLLRSANGYFPVARLGPADVVSAWAGIRPLVPGGKEAGSTSREHEIVWTAPGLITITGGKLTTYRLMAAELVDALAPALGRPIPPSASSVHPLPGGDLASVAAEIDRAAQQTGNPQLAAELVGRYGSEWPELWALVGGDPPLAKQIAPPLPYIAASARWAVEREMARTLGDILIRRLPVAFETRDHGLGAARAILPLVAPLLGWDASRAGQELERYAAEAAAIFTIEPAR